MKNLNGFQLHQQIKAIDPTIEILFVTALDILDELLSIVPGLSKDQIMKKPVDKKEFINTVKNFTLTKTTSVLNLTHNLLISISLK
jgi:DNA-binding response OmpR family regulator